MIFQGIVKKGSGEATKTGYPTANVDVGEIELDPGVYAGFAMHLGEKLPSVVCWGIPGPDDEPKFEVHIFDYVGDLYGRDLAVEVVGEKISTLEDLPEKELRAKIEADVAKARHITENYV